MVTTIEKTDVAEQLAEMNRKLDRMGLVLEDLGRRLESFDDLKEDLVPIAHGALKIASSRLSELEQAGGALDFAAESAAVMKTIATSFSRQDVKALGQNVVKILMTVRNLTQPEVLEIADRAALALRESPAPKGKMGLLKALRDPGVKRGMTLLFTVLRELGNETPNGDDRAGPAKTDWL